MRHFTCGSYLYLSKLFIPAVTVWKITANILYQNEKAPPCRSCFCGPVSPHWFLSVSTEAPPSGMSKNGYFFQEMGESEPPQEQLDAPYTTFSTLASWVGSSLHNSCFFFFIRMLPIICVVQYKGMWNKARSCPTDTGSSRQLSHSTAFGYK